MKRKRILAAVAAVCGLTLQLTGRVAGAEEVGGRPAGDYIVVLRAGSETPDQAVEFARSLGVDVRFTYRHALKGYAGRFSPDAIRRIERDPAVAYVEKDDVVSADAVPQPLPPWGLDRIDQRNLPLNQFYNFDTTGSGVTAYIIDSGINVSHVEFASRAVNLFDAFGGTGDDCNGHGTHVAGTVGGTTYGVAKGVTLVGVRVLGCGGGGTWSGVIAGVDWVTAHHVGGPAVANMSLGGSANAAVDAAVDNSINDGISYSVAAGNESTDACTRSPARVPRAMTIGATTRSDSKAGFSNYGSCVDWYAPGDGIESAYVGSPIAAATLSGTSMAAPHNAGAAARYLQEAPWATPSQVRSYLASWLTQGVVTGAMSSSNNDLLYTPGVQVTVSVGPAIMEPCTEARACSMTLPDSDADRALK